MTLVPSPALPAKPTAPVLLSKAGAVDLSAFSCGDDGIDHWLRRLAVGSEGYSARVYVVLADTKVIAYFTLSNATMDRESMPVPKQRRNAPDPLPAVLLGRLGVDTAYKRNGIGANLVRHAMLQTLAVSRIAGVGALIVQPLDTVARGLYVKLGFVDFRDTSGTAEMPPMLMPIGMIEAAFTGV